MAVYIHPSANVEPSAVIGDESKIWHLAYVRNGAILGQECIIGRGVFVDVNVRLGSRVKVQNYVSIYEGVIIEDGVFIGPHVVFTNDKLPRAVNPDGTLKTASDWTIVSTLVREGASLGANTTVVCGVTIGRWAMVGSGSVVTKDVPDQGLVVGNPARLIGYVCKCGERIPKTVNVATYICDCDK